jgi:CHAD domain-containing protein
VRIAAKKARYELELVEDVLPEAAEAVERLKPLQSLLGEVHDADVRLAFLPRYLVRVGRDEQPGAVRLVGLALAARDAAAAALEVQMAAWPGEEIERMGEKLRDEA